MAKFDVNTDKLNDILVAYFIDWFNNWTSIDKFKEHHGLTDSQVASVLSIGKDLNEAPKQG